jgi:molybdate transport repressor ModE-like protein
MDLKYRIWFEEKEMKVFGYGLHNLLRYVKIFGSMNKACKAMGMSYTKASEIVSRAESILGFEILRRTTGGSMGGGSEITEKGIEIMSRYDEFLQEADLVLKELYIKHLRDVL